jgi:hypothetical protein
MFPNKLLPRSLIDKFLEKVIRPFNKLASVVNYLAKYAVVRRDFKLIVNSVFPFVPVHHASKIISISIQVADKSTQPTRPHETIRSLIAVY